MEPSEEIRRVVHRWLVANTEGDTDAVMARISEQRGMLAIGTDGEEWWHPVSTSTFSLSTSASQKVTVNTASSTTYTRGTSSTASDAVKRGDSVLVLGTVDGTTITASRVILQATGGSAPASVATVVPFQRGAPSSAKQAGLIPQNYTEGSGTIAGGATANKANEAALAAYPGGIVDRVVKLSNGEYEVHNIASAGPTTSSTRTSRSSAPTKRRGSTITSRMEHFYESPRQNASAPRRRDPASTM
jgi:hypothetical protein